MIFSTVTIFHVVEFVIFLLIFAWAYIAAPSQCHCAACAARRCSEFSRNWTNFI